MKKNLLLGTVFVLCGLVVAGCNHGKDDASSLPSTDSSGNGQNTLAAALEADYSNMTVAAVLSYDMMGMGIEEESFMEYVYQGYTIIDTGSADSQYMYYHDYQGESYLYFEDNYGTGDAWLNRGMSDAKLGLENTYFSMNYALKYLHANDAIYASGYYIISDPEVVETLNTTMFYFAWFNNIEYVMLSVSGGYITQIIGLCSIDNDDEFVKIQLGNFGSTTFNESSLPPVPNADNVKTYYEYTGTTPTPDIYIESLTVEVVGDVASDSTADVILDLEKTAEVAVSYLPADANKKDITWHSSDENIVAVDFHSTSGHRTIQGVGAGNAEIYATAVGENGTTVTSNRIQVRVNPLQEQNKENCVYDFTFANVLEDGTVLANNNIQTNATHVITSNRAGVRDGKYSSIFEAGKQIFYLDPLSTDFSKPSGAEVVFDFDDQQVSSISLYYGLMYSAHSSYLNRIKSAKIMTSNDGVSWNEIDILEEIQTNISSSYKKLMEHEFAPATKVKIRLESSMVGNQCFFAMDDVAFMANENCHMHEDSSLDIPVESIVISTATTSLKIGDTTNFAAIVSPNDATNKTVTWKSSNPAIVSVTANGLATAESAGSAEIYAVNADETVESNHVTITVAERDHLPENYLGVYFGETYNSPLAESKLTVVDIDHANVEIENTTYQFVVDYYDADSRFYVFKGLDAVDDMLRLKLSEFSGAPVMEVFGTCGDHTFGNNFTNTGSEFTRYVPSTSIDIRCSAEDNKVVVGHSISIYASVLPSNAYYKELTRTVSDPDVADFENEESSVLIGKKAGEVTITYRNEDGISQSITIIVEEVKPVTSIRIDAPKTEIELGESIVVSATMTPEDYNEGSFTWSSSDKNIATVSVNSVTGQVSVVGKALGTCTITCTDSKSGVSGSIEIRVTGTSDKLPADMIGTWTADLSDNEAYYNAIFTFTFDAQGNLNWSDDVLNYDIEMSLTDQDGNTYTFTNSDGDTFTFIYDGTTLTVISFDDSQSMYYFDTPFDCTK